LSSRGHRSLEHGESADSDGDRAQEAHGWLGHWSGLSDSVLLEVCVGCSTKNVQVGAHISWGTSCKSQICCSDWARCCGEESETVPGCGSCCCCVPRVLIAYPRATETRSEIWRSLCSCRNHEICASGSISYSWLGNQPFCTSNWCCCNTSSGTGCLRILNSPATCGTWALGDAQTDTYSSSAWALVGTGKQRAGESKGSNESPSIRVANSCVKSSLCNSSRTDSSCKCTSSWISYSWNISLEFVHAVTCINQQGRNGSTGDICISWCDAGLLSSRLIVDPGSPSVFLTIIGDVSPCKTVSSLTSLTELQRVIHLMWNIRL
jgi:hypothetical protein